MIRNSKNDSRLRSKQPARVINSQQLNWIKNRNSGVSISETENGNFAKSDIALNNWGQVSKRVVNSGLQSDSSRQDPSICRKCFDTLKCPMMLIPCGHSFCDLCLNSPQSECPSCFVVYQHKVPNLALQEIINASETNGRDSNLSLASAMPDFDQEPEEVFEKYNQHLNGLQSRIKILSDESDEIEKVLTCLTIDGIGKV
jgi:Zinc finger, C3HC4 type (RING finger)